jgi:hypothetical protein
VKTFTIQPRERLIVLIVGDLPDEAHTLTVPVGAGCGHRSPLVVSPGSLYLIGDLSDPCRAISPAS